MCVLRVSGDFLEIDHFLKASYLEPLIVFKKGEPRFGGKHNETSGFNVSISHAEDEDLESQIIDSVDFLKKNMEELLKLKHDLTAFSAEIDFAISTPSEEIAVWTRRFPVELLRLLNLLEIELAFTVYPRSN